jgi:hypothetical protein
MAPVSGYCKDSKRKYHPDDDQIEKPATHFRIDGYPNIMIFLKNHCDV